MLHTVLFKARLLFSKARLGVQVINLEVSSMVVGAVVNLEVGGAVSVSHGDAGHRYECKVVDIEDNMVLLHWHGYKRKSWQDFWLDLNSDLIGSIEAANREPPRPAKSLKARNPDHVQGQAEDIARTQELVTPDTMVPDSDSECCRKCSKPLQELSIKCDSCVYRMHMHCSGLAWHTMYRMFEYDVSNVCELCVVAKKSESKDSAAGEPDTIDKMCRVWKKETGSDYDSTIRGRDSSSGGVWMREPNGVEQRQAEKRDAEQLGPRDQSGKDTRPEISKDESPTIPPKGICKKYRRGECPHGANGRKLVENKKCEYRHPRRCINFCKAGTDGLSGCRKGNNCRFFHPTPCKDSEKGAKCRNSKCKLLHFKLGGVALGAEGNRGGELWRKEATPVAISDAQSRKTTKNYMGERIENMFLSLKENLDALQRKQDAFQNNQDAFQKNLEEMWRQLAQTRTVPFQTTSPPLNHWMGSGGAIGVAPLGYQPLSAGPPSGHQQLAVNTPYSTPRF